MRCTVLCQSAITGGVVRGLLSTQQGLWVEEDSVRREVSPDVPNTVVLFNRLILQILIVKMLNAQQEKRTEA